ncbi:ROK family protein [Vibrio sp. T187]|uniref:ROK family protein n=1 Tax=Vibrio TaxID=662 RepID=UPI0010CA1251|nr:MULTISPECIES: ROK family protein [Vibrio]MBW3698205.1 ROK family protein [Vibrio sp. T187]
MHYGFDIGGTKIEIVAFDDDYQEVFKKRLPTPGNDYAKFLSTLAELVETADEVCGCDSYVGIGMPGVIDIHTGKLLSSNIPAASGQNIAADLSQRLNRNTELENDCKCFAYSEANGGSGDGFSSVFGAVLGTGVGGGLCFNGQLVKGRNGIAGEWGHSPLPAMFVEKYGLPIRDCGCGHKGCIERYISGRGLAFLHRFFDGEDVSTKEVIDRMRGGDDIAKQAFSAFIDILACSLANVIHTYDPDVIVIGGGLSKVPELYTQVKECLSEHLLSAVIMPDIVPPKFGDSSGVRGAAMLAS